MVHLGIVCDLSLCGYQLLVHPLSYVSDILFSVPLILVCGTKCKKCTITEANSQTTVTCDKCDIEYALTGSIKTCDCKCLPPLLVLVILSYCISYDEGAVISYGWGVASFPKIVCTEISPQPRFTACTKISPPSPARLYRAPIPPPIGGIPPFSGSI